MLPDPPSAGDETGAEQALLEALRLLQAGDPRAAAVRARASLDWLVEAPAVRRVNPLLVLGRALLDDGDYAAALSPLRQALAGCAPPIVSTGHAAQRCSVLLAVAAALRTTGDYPGAGAALDEAERLATTWLSSGDLLRVDVLAERGLVAKYAGRAAEAVGCQQTVLRLTQEALGRGHPEVATVEHNLAGALHAAGQAHAAEPHARRAVAIRTAALGHDHPASVADRAALAGVLIDTGQLDEAAALLHACLDAHHARYGDQHHEVAVALHNLGCLHARRGDIAAAHAHLTRALDVKRSVLGPAHPETQLTARELDTLRLDLADPQEGG